MSDERFADAPHEQEDFGPDVEDPRSLLSTLWFRAVLAVAALSVVGAVAVPYVLDWTRPAAPPPRAAVPSWAHVTPPTPTLAASVPVPTPMTPAVLPPASAKPSTSPPPSSLPVESIPVAPPAPRVREREPLPSRASALGSTPPMASMSAQSSTPTFERLRAAPVAMPVEASAGVYWIQVGAYKDAETARRVAARLRELGYHVEESSAAAPKTTMTSTTITPSPVAMSASSPGAERYEVLVTGAAANALSERLSSKGLAAESIRAGVVVKPPLPLADAIALSKELALDGLKVEVRREGPAATTGAASSTSASSARGAVDSLHRVRVGAFSDRTGAVTALRELSEKGYPGFIARNTP